MLILSDLIDEIKEKIDSPEQGLSELEAGNNQLESSLLSPHMEYITRHVYHRVPKDNDPNIEKRVGQHTRFNTIYENVNGIKILIYNINIYYYIIYLLPLRKTRV